MKTMSILCIVCKVLQPRSGTICTYCDTTKTQYQKHKERAVVNFLNSQSIVFDHNKMLHTVTKRCSPDVLIRRENFYIIVEIDEERHRLYSLEMEEERMNWIQNFLDQPCHFIRYNPDAFKIGNKYQKVSQQVRLETLKNRLDEITECPRQIVVEYLFYNS